MRAAITEMEQAVGFYTTGPEPGEYLCQGHASGSRIDLATALLRDGSSTCADAPGYFVWTTRLGVHYRVRPPLIIQPVPDAVPRDPPPVHQPDDHGNQVGEPIWWKPPWPPAEPERPPSPPDLFDPVPF